MTLRSFGICLAILTNVTCAAAEEPTPPGAVWKGSVALGAELDEHGLPTEDNPQPEKPARFRLGFSGQWSFALHWERLEPKSGESALDSKDLTEDERKLLDLTNAERKRLKLKPLQPDPELMKLAQAHCAAMARLDRIGHDIDGKTFSQRMQQAKYPSSRAGENVAQGQRTPAEAVTSWMGSPGHKANILQAEYTHLGVARAASQSGKIYWTQVFAARAP